MAQKTFIERVSLEAGAGYNLSISDFEEQSQNDFGGFRSFYLGANYHLTDLMGLRFSYANNAFEDKDDSSMGLTLHKFMAEATINIIQFIEIQPLDLEVVGHAGFGASLGKSSLSSDIDKMGNFQIGLMPKYQITDNFSIHLDATYVVNIRQNFNYNGLPAFQDNRHVTGEYFVFNAGVGVSF
jgi:hypothetical protein